MKKRILVYLLAVGTALISCNKDKISEILPTTDSENPFSTSSDTLMVQDSTESKKKLPSLGPQKIEGDFYSAIFFTKDNKDSLMHDLEAKYTKKERYVIWALNRLDADNRWRADTLVIPKVIDSTLMAYCPFPRRLDILSDVEKMVVFSYPIQAYAVYTSGDLVKWGPTSMGKKSAKTKTGLMFTNWKKELAISTVDKSWKLPYNFNIHNTLGIGWHQYDLPGYPASHSCLRLLMDDAKWLYKYADQWILTKGGASVRANGTPVIVFGEYGWGKMKPWKNLYKDPNYTNISVEEMEKIIQPHLSKILEEQHRRQEVLKEIEAEKQTIDTVSSTTPQHSAE